jgi:cytoskeletal protein RodZ
MSKFTLSTYLMLSVVIILSGIAWVIFTQTDSRFNYSSEFSSLNAEQDEILRQYYQLQEKYLPSNQKAATQAPQPAVQITRVLPQIANVSAQPQANVTASATAEVWSSRITNEQEPDDFLRNNPWSPDYQPGY